jgi:GT2 family glycosyltransferase
MSIKYKEIRLGFVVTNFNSSSHTTKMIESLSCQKDFSSITIIVVDNGSNFENLNELNILNQSYENVFIIYNPENIGYFRGLNVGIHFLRRNFPEVNVVIVGNNDLIFPNDFSISLYKIITQIEKFPVISPRIFTEHGISQNPHVIEKLSFVREFIYDIYFSSYFLARFIKWLAKSTNAFTDRKDELKNDQAGFIYQGHGSCYILTPLFFENFDELFAPTFLMGEEFFLSYQLYTKGFKVYFEPAVEIIHNCHSSIDQVPNKKIWGFARVAHKEYRKYIKISNFYKPKFNN